jgi:hypothetical protein
MLHARFGPRMRVVTDDRFEWRDVAMKAICALLLVALLAPFVQPVSATESIRLEFRRLRCQTDHVTQPMLWTPENCWPKLLRDEDTPESISKSLGITFSRRLADEDLGQPNKNSEKK